MPDPPPLLLELRVCKRQLCQDGEFIPSVGFFNAAAEDAGDVDDERPVYTLTGQLGHSLPSRGRVADQLAEGDSFEQLCANECAMEYFREFVANWRSPSIFAQTPAGLVVGFAVVDMLPADDWLREVNAHFKSGSSIDATSAEYSQLQFHIEWACTAGNLGDGPCSGVGRWLLHGLKRTVDALYVTPAVQSTGRCEHEIRQLCWFTLCSLPEAEDAWQKLGFRAGGITLSRPVFEGCLEPPLPIRTRPRAAARRSKLAR